VIAVDTNVLVYAHREELAPHRRARSRLIELAQGDALWAIPVFCLTEFARVATHPRVFDPPYTVSEIRSAIERLLASPSLMLLHPGERFTGLFLDALQESSATGNLVCDAQIVAVCREHGVTALLTEDRDFARFPGFATQSLPTSRSR
jgi:toxin-antitoxin system PIN domain toxin